mgnify:CR=1 FL=1
MIGRLAIVLIISFWLLMNAALLRLWIDPDRSEILTIPVEHVVKQVFLHEQTSNLVILQGQQRVGALTLQPRRFPLDGSHLVDFSGNLLLQIPFVGQQPFSWRGTLEMDAAYAVRSFRVHIDSRSPAVVTEIEIRPGTQEAFYSVQYEQEAPLTSTIPLTQEGITQALQAFGLDVTLLEQVIGSIRQNSLTGNPPATTARQAQIRIHGERIQAFQISVTQGGNPILEADISQIGQVLGLKTSLGFNLTPDETLP